MVALPALTPVTKPVAASTVATEVLLELQVPPRLVSAKAEVAPWQIVVVPVIAPALMPETIFTVVVAVEVPHPPETV